MRAKARHTRWTAILAAVAMAVMAAGPGAAAPTDYLKLAPDGYEAFVFIDVKQVRKSEAWQKVQAEIMNPNVQTGLAMIEQFTGLRLPDDLDAIVVAGKVSQGNQSGCVFINGRFDRARLESFVAMNPAYTETKVAGGTILSWLDEGKGELTHGAFLRNDLVAIGQKAAVEAALAVAAGERKSLADNAAAQTLMADVATSPLAIAMVVRPETVPPEIARVPVLQKVQSVLFALTQAPGNLSLTARVEAESQEMARQMADIARGIVALGMLQENQPRLAQIAGRTTVGQTGNVVEAKATVELAQAETFFRNRIQGRGAMRPNVGGRRIQAGEGAAEPKPVPPQW